MTVTERQIVIVTKDSDGNIVMLFPVTSAKYVEGAVRTVNGEEPDANGNVVAVSFDSYWEANETVQLGDIRFPKGRENSGYIFECMQAGTTGAEQPAIDEDAVIANFSALERIGHMRLIFNLAEKEVDEILACGVTYSRATYPELWQYVQNKPALLLTEEEWQAKYTETNGMFVPYYSSGNGSTTFRTPMLGAYLKGAVDSSEIGLFKEAGLPNIEGSFETHRAGHANGTGTFTVTGDRTGWGEGDQNTNTHGTVNFDASLSNPIYGNSDTVTPNTMTGIWVIKAIGLVVDSANTDLTEVLTGVEQTAQRVTAVETTVGSMIDYVVETWVDGTEWYRRYNSGWVEQGGQLPAVTGTGTNIECPLNTPFAANNYTLILTPESPNNASGDNGGLGWLTKDTDKFTFDSNDDKVGGKTGNWLAYGMGA